jgi:S1-C subfamily serine protease
MSTGDSGRPTQRDRDPEFWDGAGESRSERERRRTEARAAWKATGMGWRVFPRSLLGIALTLAALGVGAGISGAVLFAYYDSRVADNTAQLETFNTNLDARVNDALGILDEVTANTYSQLDAALGPYRALLQNAEGVSSIGASVQASIAVVETRNAEGGEVIGSATAVARDGDTTVLVTSLSLVRASTTDPGPGIAVLSGDQRWEATLFSWDDATDLAVLTANTTLEPAVLADPGTAGRLTGLPVFAVSGFQVTVSPGTVLNVNSSGFRYLALLSRDFAGGPLLDTAGAVVGFVTPGYAPGGLDGDLYWSPSLEQLCAGLLSCAGDGGVTPR